MQFSLSVMDVLIASYQFSRGFIDGKFRVDSPRLDLPGTHIFVTVSWKLQSELLSDLLSDHSSLENRQASVLVTHSA